MKVLVVREAFGLDGIDYPRGTEITDPALVARIGESHPGHVLTRTDPDVPDAQAPAETEEHQD